MPLPTLWQITPLGALAIAIGVAHEVGRRRLRERQSIEHRLLTRRRSAAFYAGLVLIFAVVSGPLERWSMPWLSVHMTIFVLEMFYLPPLLISGGPRVPLLFAFPVERRRTLLRAYYRSKSLGWMRGLISVMTNPIVAVLLFSATIIVWLQPGVYNWAWSNDWVMNWLAAPNFVLAGYLFWRVILPSHPSPSRGSTRLQIGAIVVAIFEIQVFAMALAIFTKDPWYSMNVIMDGSAAALRDQRLGSSILWIGGDLWAVPALALVGYRVYASEGGISASLERALGRT